MCEGATIKLTQLHFNAHHEQLDWRWPHLKDAVQKHSLTDSVVGMIKMSSYKIDIRLNSFLVSDVAKHPAVLLTCSSSTTWFRLLVVLIQLRR